MMEKTLKVAGGVALIVIGLAAAAYGVKEFIDAPAGTIGKPGKLPLMVGALAVILGVGLIGNAMGKIKM
jgi:hypothetical protein